MIPGPVGKGFLLVSVLLAAACSRPDFVPDVRLAQARPIIDATAEFHDLYPAPALVSGKKTFGLNAPKAKQVSPGELTDRVETALFEALDRAGVFIRMTRFDPEPDIVLTGRINALHEHYRPRVWTHIPGVDTVAQVLDLKTHVSSGEADLTLFVLKPDGETVGTYQGKSSFQETFNPTGDVPPGTRLNQALSEAVQQIQEKLLRDTQLRTAASR